jgi:hypothetical protein
VRGDLSLAEVASSLQELPGPLDAAGDDVLVRRRPGGRLELPRQVVGAEVGDRGQLLQARAGLVFLDVLDDGAEPPPRQRAVGPARRPAAARTWRIRWTARTLASDSAANARAGAKVGRPGEGRGW